MEVVEIINNSKKVLSEFEKACYRALVAVGLDAEGNAQEKVKETVYESPPSDWYVRTGALRNSITNEVDKDKKEVSVGSPLEYAPYVELGTGQYYSGGRKDGWLYEGSDGQMHFTRGMEARPFLKPAISDNVDNYKKIIEDQLNG